MSTPASAEPAGHASAIGAEARETVTGAADPSGIAHPPAIGPGLCANCSTPLTGKYCSQCGQRHHDRPVHDFWHFASEALEDLTHADSRLWQTLRALLFRPGFLTGEFLEGRRARYLPPVRLYLVVSLIFFVIVGLDSRIANSYVVVSYSGHSFHYQVVPVDGASPPDTAAPTSAQAGPANGLASLAPTPAARQQICERSETYIAQHTGWFARFAPRVLQSCLMALAKGGVEHFNDMVERNLERAMFLFLPLLALAMKPLYLRPARHYIEHLLFFLHNHAFLFVVLGASTLVKLITSSSLVLEPINTAIVIWIPMYFYLSMRRVYGQGRWLTLSKLTALGVVYFFLGLVMIAATASYSFLML
ncbi:MAG: DUF3667 domain-containing protein [Steroidobacteraceae bacterium]